MEPESAKVVQESFPREPGHRGGEAMDPGTPGLTGQHVSNMPRAPILPEGPREATYQPLGTEPEDTEGSRRGSELLEHQLLGAVTQEGLPLKGKRGKERLGSQEVDEDRDIDESSPQDSPPSLVSPGLQSPPDQGGPPPQAVSREAPGISSFPAEGAIPLPVDFLFKASAETQVSEPDGPGEGPPAERHDGPPEFMFHVEIKANVQKDQGHPQVDLEGAALPGAPGEEREPLGPSEGEDTKKTDLLEASEKQPAAGLPGKPVSRVPQLKGLCLELLCSCLATSYATQAAGTATELRPLLGSCHASRAPTPTPGQPLNWPPKPLLTFPASSCPPGSGCSSHACPPVCMSPTPHLVLLSRSLLWRLGLWTRVHQPTGGWGAALCREDSSCSHFGGLVICLRFTI